MSGFDLERFRGAQLVPREAEVPVPDLAPFFAPEEPAVWVVRGLAGEEIERSNEASQRHALVANAVEALAAAASREDQVEGLKTLLGYGSETPAGLAKRFDHLVFGSVSPRIDREIAVRLFKSFPIVAYQLTNKILELTGLGPDLGKPPHSTSTPA